MTTPKDSLYYITCDHFYLEQNYWTNTSASYSLSPCSGNTVRACALRFMEINKKYTIPWQKFEHLWRIILYIRFLQKFPPVQRAGYRSSKNRRNTRRSSTTFLCFVDRTSWYKLRQWPTWCTLALLYNMSITILYRFQALYIYSTSGGSVVFMQHLVSSSQSVAVRCTGWESSLSPCLPDGHWLRGRYQMLHKYNWASWWWVYNAWNL